MHATDKFINGHGKLLLAPVDWALAVALRLHVPILAFAMVPVFVDIVCSYIVYFSPTSQGTRLVIDVVRGGAYSFGCAAVMMMFVEILQGKVPKERELARRALKFLPKILLSYLLVKFLVELSILLIIPAIIFAVFFVWAPAFCVAETYADEFLKPSRDDEDDDEEDEGSIFSKSSSRMSYFQKKSAFELGLVRSSRFAHDHPFVSAQVVLLMFASVIIPGTLVVSVMGDGFITKVLQLSLSGVLKMFAVAIWAGAFLMLLPNAARKELRLGDYREPEEVGVGANVTRLRIASNLTPNLFLMLACIFAVFGSIEVAKHQSSIPTSVRIELQEQELYPDELMLTFLVSDTEKQFRWLRPEGFMLELERDGEPQEGSAEPAASVLKPARVRVLTTEKELLGANEFSPSYKPLLIQLFYPVESELEPRLPFKLYYHSFAGSGEAVFSGRLGLRIGAQVSK